MLPLGIRKKRINSADNSVHFQCELSYVGVYIFFVDCRNIPGWLTSWQITQQELTAGGINLGLKATTAVGLEHVISSECSLLNFKKVFVSFFLDPDDLKYLLRAYHCFSIPCESKYTSGKMFPSSANFLLKCKTVTSSEHASYCC